MARNPFGYKVAEWQSILHEFIANELMKLRNSQADFEVALAFLHDYILDTYRHKLTIGEIEAWVESENIHGDKNFSRVKRESFMQALYKACKVALG